MNGLGFSEWHRWSNGLVFENRFFRYHTEIHKHIIHDSGRKSRAGPPEMTSRILFTFPFLPGSPHLTSHELFAIQSLRKAAITTTRPMRPTSVIADWEKSARMRLICKPDITLTRDNPFAPGVPHTHKCSLAVLGRSIVRMTR